MGAAQHAFDYLAGQAAPPRGVVALWGDEPFLKQLVQQHLRRALFGDDADTPYATFNGESADWRDVSDELHTVSLFGGGPRLVVVDTADDFVKRFRGQLEETAKRSKLPGVLLLDVTTWPGNTRLAKLVAQHGLAVDCRPPVSPGSRSKALDTGRTLQWLVDWASGRHEIQLQKKAASVLLERVGPQFGLLDQELAKLALYVPLGGKVTAELASHVVGGWRMQTTWNMIDAALDGKTAEALQQLDRLLMAGQPAQALFAQLSWSLRRLAAATRVYERSLRTGRRMPVGSALEKAGVPHWDVGKAERQLKRLGRRRAGQVYRWLLESDLALKGSHSTGDRARWVLEQLLFQLAGQPDRSA